jgi:hypothetical protein
MSAFTQRLPWHRALCAMVLISVCLWAERFSLMACKYSVRDVAFVDLGSVSFEFVSVIPSPEMDHVKSRIQPVATAVFLDSNVHSSWVATEDASRYPALESLGNVSGGQRFYLCREGLSPLLMHPGNALGDQQDDELWQWMEHTIDSPMRSEILKHLLEAYAVILVAEGNLGSENERARSAANAAAEAIAKLMPKMPKPVDVPPQVVVIPHEQYAVEASMLWSLGMDSKPSEEVQAVVLVGRGRRLGPVLRADELTSTGLQSILAVAGQDCECDLDRSWMQGPMIPLRWGPDRQKAAFDALDFDPENPLVKAEISRILARGKQGIRVTNRADIGTNMDMLLLGYSEEVIELEAEEPVFASGTMETNTADVETETDASSSIPAVLANDDLPEKDVIDPLSSDPPEKVGSARKTLVMLAVFCMLALLGGIGVLLFGRRHG